MGNYMEKIIFGMIINIFIFSEFVNSDAMKRIKRNQISLINLFLHVGYRYFESPCFYLILSIWNLNVHLNVMYY